MFSNRYRGLKVSSLLILILLLCLYSHFLQPDEITARDYVLNPEKYENSILTVKRDGRILEIGDGYYDIFIDGEEFRTYDEIPGAQEGESISGEFIFHSSRILEIRQVHVHLYRDVKLALSIIAFAAVLVLLWRAYRFNYKKLVWEER